MPEGGWVTIISMYLKNDAKLWWQSRLQEDVEAQQLMIKTWHILKPELKG